MFFAIESGIFHWGFIIKYESSLDKIERLKLIKDYDDEYFIKLNIPSHNFTLFENGEI